MQQGGATPTSKHEYIHRDHIGSVVAITGTTLNSSADVQWQANGAWGERRFQQWNDMPDPDFVPTGIARSFTDHEHLDSVGLIHMNGRVYDPELGRFMSADPFVQAPYNTQSYNRYSYVFNNPLSFTDPSGYTSECGGNTDERVASGGTTVQCNQQTPDEEEAERQNQEDAMRDSHNQTLSETYNNNRRTSENNLPGYPGSLGGWGSITGGVSAMTPIADACSGASACITGATAQHAEVQVAILGAAVGGEGLVLAKLAHSASKAEKVEKAVEALKAANGAEKIGWKLLSKERQNAVNSFMTRHGNGADGAKKLLNEIQKNGVPKGLDRQALESYANQIKNVGGNKAATNASEVFQTRLQILENILGGF